MGAEAQSFIGRLAASGRASGPKRCPPVRSLQFLTLPDKRRYIFNKADTMDPMIERKGNRATQKRKFPKTVTAAYSEDEQEMAVQHIINRVIFNCLLWNASYP